MNNNTLQNHLEQLHFLDNEQKLLKFEILIKKYDLLNDVMLKPKHNMISAELREEGNSHFNF